MLPELIEREAERKEAFGGFAWHVAGQPVPAHRTELLDVVAECALDRVKSRRRLSLTQSGTASAEVVACHRLDFSERWRQASRDFLGQLAAHRAAEHDD